jgi:hypothetical protein
MTGAPAAVGKQASQSPLTRRLPGTKSASVGARCTDASYRVNAIAEGIGNECSNLGCRLGASAKGDKDRAKQIMRGQAVVLIPRAASTLK